jgi:hypothetical protein
MYLAARFISTPNEPIVIANASPEVLRDSAGAARLRRSLSRALADLPVALRNRQDNVYAIDGDEAAMRYAFDPMLDTLPVVGIVLEPRLRMAVWHGDAATEARRSESLLDRRTVRSPITSSLRGAPTDH